ncbi:3-isopropylmalate dehydratase small subunit [Jannaschia sp. LMIT008]|uniref:3-isopropylmalate dehydratase small subunit n=1 Tax=Jannaschia maritima TaxID=3032585 RepID=UPI002810D83B|nr:3-isopropylmalate dehydratase small subunit [Jannaschia sp. LMIT008]
MTGWTTLTGIAAPFLRDDVNTDVVIPSREMKRVSKQGLADGLFANVRYREGRDPDPAFVLNRPPRDRATVLLAGRNFGCGSSREHAVWALRDYGFRAVVAQGFGGIFFDNCLANGVAPVALDADAVTAIAAWCDSDPVGNEVTVDLDAMEVRADSTHPFDLPAQGRRMIREGLSPIDLTLEDADAIAAWVEADRAARPWLHGGHPRARP